MDDRLRMLIGAGIGAATMYYFDPARGRYRRALVTNQLVHAGHKARRAASVVGRDIHNRALGTAATLRSTLAPATADDTVLEARVRTCIGRAVSHPASVHAEARDGIVTLSGPILEHEIGPVIECVERVHGVKEVRNELEAHAEPGNVPGLQGKSRPRGGPRAPFMQTNWSPAERLTGALGGALAMVCSARQRSVAGYTLGAAGLLLFSRAASNFELRRLLGAGVLRSGIEVHKSIRIHAPVEKVFALWDDPANFPSFMSHVLRVRRLSSAGDDDRWRWTVRGPSGTHVEFDAVVTAREENRLLAWRTESGATVQHGGVVRFIGNDDGTTTIDVKMSYIPIGGALGHAVARLFGVDPKHRMDDDLLRLKTYLETGRTPRDAASKAIGEEPRPQRNEEAQLRAH
jgi:uncharacterized membrane protein